MNKDIRRYMPQKYLFYSAGSDTLHQKSINCADLILILTYLELLFMILYLFVFISVNL